MQLKTYQQQALDALDRFLTEAPARGPADAFAAEVARQDAEARAMGDRPVPRGAYQPLGALPDVPYACLRIPTGGGKTLLAAEAVRVFARATARPCPLVLWFVPSDAIKRQTLDALKDRRHAYRQRLDAAFAQVRVFDVEAFERLRPIDLATSCCVIVATIQAFRVEDTTDRRVYAHHEELEPFFAGVPTAGMEEVSAAEAAANPMLTAGAVKFSFANLLYLHRPLMIVDEAHNAVSGLTREMQARLRPAAIVEFSATPKNLNNILVSVTAAALKDEQMIKLPIRLRPHEGWRAAVDGAIRTRKMLEERALRDPQHIRPLVLYQAQPRGREPTVDQIRDYLIERGENPAHIRRATGDQRELDGVDLRDPAVQVRHVITVQALREGWDCPSAYVLCATQALRSATAVEQLLGRVLRMPYATRRRDEALNMAYAHVSEPEFNETAQALTEKLIGMGFTDEEVRGTVTPAGLAADAQGTLFDPSPVRPQPVWQVSAADTPETRAALDGMAEDAVEYAPGPAGTLRIGVKGAVAEAVADRLIALAPADQRPTAVAALARHRARVEARRSPAERGAVIEVPLLLARMEGGALVPAETERLMEFADWALPAASAILDAAALSFERDEEVVQIDLAGERLVYTRQTVHQPRLTGLGDVDDDTLAAGLIAWLERACRAADLPQDQLRGWLSAAVAHLRAARGIPVATLVDWQDVLAAVLRQRIAAARTAARAEARQAALFAPGAAPATDLSVQVRFDAATYADVALVPLGAARFAKHLLGNDAAPAFDGEEGGEEFACAQSLDGLPEVEVWVRNIARHRDSFWLPLLEGRFFPDFVARLTDGRLLVVEYKGAHLATAEDTRNKAQIGALWAQASGNVFALVERVKNGQPPARQMQAAIGAGR